MKWRHDSINIFSASLWDNFLALFFLFKQPLYASSWKNLIAGRHFLAEFGILLEMNKIVPFEKISNMNGEKKLLAGASMVVDKKGVPMGFVFGRDSFIALLSKIDEQFENGVLDQKKAFDNFAGRIIDVIEEKLPVKKSFLAGIKVSISDAKKTGWIPLADLKRALNV